MKLCIFADLHLRYGSPYDREPGDRLEDQVSAGKRIVEIARERECSLILNGGDTFEGPTVQPEEYDAFRRAFGGWQGLIGGCLGNGRHDSAKRSIAAPTVLDSRVGLLVETFTTPKIQAYEGVAVAYLPWCPVDRLVAARNGGERADINREAAAHLLSIAQSLRAECAARFPGRPCILLGHWCVEGAAGWEFMQQSEPVLPIGDLEALGFDLCAFGHVHEPKSLNPLPLTAPLVLSIGSPMPCNFGEAETDHGCWIYDTEEREVEFIPIASREFVTLDLSVREWPPDGPDAFKSIYYNGAGEEAINELAKDAIVKLRYTATAEQARRIDHRKLTQALYDAGAWKVFAIEAQVERETRARVEAAREDLDVSEALDLWITSNEIPAEMAERMRERTRAYVEGGAA